MRRDSRDSEGASEDDSEYGTWAAAIAQLPRLIKAQMDKDVAFGSVYNYKETLRNTYLILENRTWIFANLLKDHLRGIPDSPDLKELKRAVVAQDFVLRARMLAEADSVINKKEPVSEAALQKYIDDLAVSPEMKRYARDFLHEQWSSIVRTSEIFSQIRKHDAFSHLESGTFTHTQPLFRNPAEVEPCITIMGETFKLLLDKGQGNTVEQRTIVADAVSGIAMALVYHDRTLSKLQQILQESREQNKQRQAKKLAERLQDIPAHNPPPPPPPPLCPQDHAYELREEARHIVNNARGVAGTVSPKSALAGELVAAIESVRRRLDKRDPDQKALGDVLLSKQNIATVAHALEIGSAVQAPPLPRRPIEMPENVSALLHNLRARPLVDALLAQPEAALVVSALAGDAALCRRYRDTLHAPEGENGFQRVLRTSARQDAVAAIKRALENGREPAGARSLPGAHSRA